MRDDSYLYSNIWTYYNYIINILRSLYFFKRCVNHTGVPELFNYCKFTQTVYLFCYQICWETQYWSCFSIYNYIINILCSLYFFKHCVTIPECLNHLIIANSRRLASRNSYENTSRSLLVPLADQVPFEQTRCAQTELSVAPARAVLATESLLGSRYLFCYQICWEAQYYNISFFYSYIPQYSIFCHAFISYY